MDVLINQIEESFYKVHIYQITILCINYVSIKQTIKRIYVKIYVKYLAKCLTCGKVSINAISSHSKRRREGGGGGGVFGKIIPLEGKVGVKERESH